VAALVAHGLGPSEALVLFARSETFPDELFTANRGWSEAEWQAAAESLRARGLLDDGGITAAGRTLHDLIESTTDTLAATLYSVSEAELNALSERLGRLAGDLARQGAIPYPNPIGLPAPDQSG
jgi:hypothetical protein